MPKDRITSDRASISECPLVDYEKRRVSWNRSSINTPMWWTITGNFGNILPIDWSKSYARKLHMPALNLNENKEKIEADESELSSEDEAVASDLDMHSLILSGFCQETEPLKTAEEVIREIDDIMEVS
ncbi:unnamed protein product [Nezara viridula]|uniref:Uncharacterized protein n=1 Tax=Nezara viridula TaxID=85310 RepID=A0A9P0MNV7_NEZVI|nr:unnamed protein product [Nezara viridula]